MREAYTDEITCQGEDEERRSLFHREYDWLPYDQNREKIENQFKKSVTDIIFLVRLRPTTWAKSKILQLRFLSLESISMKQPRGQESSDLLPRAHKIN